MDQRMSASAGLAIFGVLGSVMFCRAIAGMDVQTAAITISTYVAAFLLGFAAFKFFISRRQRWRLSAYWQLVERLTFAVATAGWSAMLALAFCRASHI